MVVDDELLQELLAKASGLYNGGEYRAAIDAWKEALGVDPSSQKAQEGIQMATLLLGDWEPAAAIVQAPAGSTPPAATTGPADGAPAVPRDLTPDQIAKRLEQGASRVRTLLRQRRYSEAVEGARSLVPIDPDSEEVQNLLEEAQQAFEAAPFIEEHLTLARELAQQERLEEAEAECKKVFSLDPTNPDGHVLLMELRTRRANEARSPAASRREDPAAGSMTMRIDASQLRGVQKPPAAPAQAAAAPRPVAPAGPDHPLEPAVEPGPGSAPVPPQAASAPSAAEALPDELFDFDPTLIDENAAAPGAAPPAAPADEGLVLEGSEDGTATSEAEEDGNATPDPDASSDTGAGDEVHVIEDPEETYVDATTVVPPAVRLVDRKNDRGPSVESLLETADDAEPIPLVPTSEPPAPPKKTPAPSPGPAAAAPGSWEQELTDLNRKTGQHEIVGRRAARTPSRKAEPDADVDLSALLGDDLGDTSAASQAARPMGETPEDDAPSIPLDLPEPVEETSEAAPAPDQDPKPEARSRVDLEADEPAMPPPEGRSRANLPIYFALLGVLLLAIGAGVWWFFLQPRSASGQVPPASTAPPPSSRSGSATSADALPTPMGSTSRQSTQPHPAPGAASPDAAPAGANPQAAPDAGGSSTVTPHAPQGAAAAAPVPQGVPAAPALPTQPAPQGASPQAPAAAPSAPPAPRSLEEVRREAASHMAEGKRLMALEKWQEAHAEFATVLALDPMSFESRELLDKTQARIDQDLKVRKDVDDARRAFEEKDYQQALWKLYRMPHDPRLGNIDLRIRNAWFNWAVVSLKGGDAADAKQKLTEVLQADPADPDAKRLMDAAEQYVAKPKDRAFYAFVDTLRLRTFDQK